MCCIDCASFVVAMFFLPVFALRHVQVVELLLLNISFVNDINGLQISLSGVMLCCPYFFSLSPRVSGCGVVLMGCLITVVGTGTVALFLMQVLVYCACVCQHVNRSKAVLNLFMCGLWVPLLLVGVRFTCGLLIFLTFIAGGIRVFFPSLEHRVLRLMVNLSILHCRLQFFIVVDSNAGFGRVSGPYVGNPVWPQAEC